MKNLRVNSKSKISEFKRKHNWLVENSTIQLYVSNITELSNEDINNLKCGDIVLKEDASGKHAYLVTFKNETGICLTYSDASVIETQSYDKVGENWVYNSEDKTPNLLDVVTKEDIESGNIENAKPIYYHGIELVNTLGQQAIFYGHILNNTSAEINTFDKFMAWITSFSSAVYFQGHGIITTDLGIKDVLVIYKRANQNSINLIYKGDSGYVILQNISLSVYFNQINDGVNKIN